MADENELPGWRKKFLANRMTIESILFEREMVMPQKEKMSTGLLVLAGIWLFYSLLLAQWVLRRGYFFVQADAESFSGLLRYAAYLKSQGVLALIKPELAGLSLDPPFYFLAYVPVLAYLTSDLNIALIAVNSLFMLVLALSVFLAVRKSRPNSSGWLGAAFALAMPFVLETARRPAPEMALMAMVAALYACYIRSEEFEQNNVWTFCFALCLSLGFFSHRFFWLYALPLVPFILTGLSSPLSRDELLKGMLPGVAINLPWYLFSAAVLASGFVPVIGAYQGFWACLKTGLASAGLPLFGLGALALAWMYFSVFMPYEKKKIVAALFWVPYLVLTWGLRGSRPELLYPAMLLPFAIGLAVMTPHAVRKYLLVLVLALGAVNQSGLVPPFSAGGYQFGGLPLPPSQVYRAGEVIALIGAGTPPKGGLVGIYGGDPGLNADSLRFAALKAGLDVKFENDPVCPACASVLILKTGAAGAPEPKTETFAAVKAQPWFAQLFAKKSELRLADASMVEFYIKVPGLGKLFEEGAYSLGPLTFGELVITDASLKIEGYDAASGSYAKGEFFSPAAALRGGDIYGLTLELEGLQLAGTGRAPVPAGMKSIKLTSGKITAYALEKYLAERFPSLSELQVSLDRTLAVSAVARGRKLEAEFYLVLTAPDVIEIRPAAFSLGSVGVSEYLLRLFSFRIDLSGNPYGFKVSGLRIRGQMLEFY